MSEDKFVAYFTKGRLPSSPESLAKKMIVTYKKPKSAYEILHIDGAIVKSEDDLRWKKREAIMKYFYDVLVVHREDYLRKFYRAYFRFKDDMASEKWDFVDLQVGEKIISMQKNDASRRVIRNLFHLELLNDTTVTNSVKSHVPFWKSLVNLYNRLELEDRLFAKSSLDLFLRPKSKKGADETNYNAMFYLFQAYQPKASIINPYVVWYILHGGGGFAVERKREAQKILTPVMSWGSYLLAFLKSDKYTEYVGIDVMPGVIKKCKDMYSKWPNAEERKGKNMKLFLCPSEKLPSKHASYFGEGGKYDKYFDTIMLCPPYFDMEIYPDGKQSVTLYPKYSDWLEGYWRKTVEVMRRCMKKDGHLYLIINDYVSLDGVKYSLVKDMTDIMVEEGFKKDDHWWLVNRLSPLRANKKDRTERLMRFVLP